MSKRLCNPSLFSIVLLGLAWSVGPVAAEPDAVAATPLPAVEARGAAAPSAPLEWSDSPGVYELDLRRRDHNPLYMAHRQSVSRQELLSARQLDAERAWQALEVYIDLASSRKRMARIDTAGEMSEALGRIDDALANAMWTGGEAYALAASLVELRAWLLGEWGRQDQLDPVVRSLLAAESRARVMNPKSSAIRFLAQVQMDKSPIRDSELAAAVLSEDPKTIRGIVKAMKRARKKSVREQSVLLLESLRSQGVEVEGIEEKSAALQ